MGLLNLLKNLGCRLGLIRTVPRQIKTPKKISPHVTSMKELKNHVLQQDTRPPLDDLSASLERVFKEAGVENRTWTVERLRDLLRTAPYRSMDRAAARQAIQQVLAAENAGIEDLVQDARLRSKALDTFDSHALVLVRERQESRERQKEALERQIRQINEACRALDTASQDDRRALQQWQARRTAYEKDMVWAMGFLIENPDEIRVASENLHQSGASD